MGRMATVVRGADGARWRVGRRWLPWRPRLRKPLDLDVPLDVGALFDGVPGVVGLLLAVVAAAVFVLFFLPLLLTVVELALVALLVMLGGMARVLLRRPWLVDAVRLDEPAAACTWKVVGWRAGGEHVAEVARRLQSGRELPPR